MAVLRATFTGTMAGVTVDNVFGLGGIDEPDHDTIVAIAAVLDTQFSATLLNPLSDALQYNDLTIVSLTDPTRGESIPTSAGGTITGAPLPTFVCARVNFQTDMRGRSFRGRTGLCGVLESHTDPATPNRLNDDARAVFAGNAHDFVENCQTALAAIAGAYYLAVVSTTTGGAPRPTPIATGIQRADVAANLGTRRGRMP